MNSNAPTYNFNGIDYNPKFFIQTSTTNTSGQDLIANSVTINNSITQSAPLYKVYFSNNINTTSRKPIYQIIPDTAYYNINNYFNTISGYFVTPPNYAGFYEFSNLCYGTGPTNTIFNIIIYKNNLPIQKGSYGILPNATTQSIINETTPVYCNVNDVISYQLATTVSGIILTGMSNYFYGRYLYDSLVYYIPYASGNYTYSISTVSGSVFYLFTFTGSGTFTSSKSPESSLVSIFMCGGGGSGGMCNNINSVASGEGAGCIIEKNYITQPNTTYNISIGAAGLTTISNSIGNSGGNTTFYNSISSIIFQAKWGGGGGEAFSISGNLDIITISGFLLSTSGLYLNGGNSGYNDITYYGYGMQNFSGGGGASPRGNAISSAGVYGITSILIPNIPIACSAGGGSNAIDFNTNIKGGSSGNLNNGGFCGSRSDSIGGWCSGPSFGSAGAGGIFTTTQPSGYGKQGVVYIYCKMN